jgi:hypothetical protein
VDSSGRIFAKFYIGSFMKIVNKIKVWLKAGKLSATLCEDLSTFLLPAT